MLGRLLLLFTIVPFVEFWLLYKISQWTSLSETVLLVIVTGIVGAGLARHEGLRVWGNIHGELAQGRMPGDQLIDALLILVAGALLVTPGVLTDAVGFGLLIPPFRSLIRRSLKSRFQSQITIVSDFQSPRQPDNIIDVEAKVVDEDDDQ